MRRNAHVIGSTLCYGGALAALLSMVAGTGTALGAERIVLGEEFTATW
ncbi:MAG: hypothetical protein WBE26_16015 [Phycisphaerae bacterium]